MKTVIMLSLIALLYSIHQSAHAYTPDAHKAITQQVAEATTSSIDRILKDELGISNGILEAFQGKTAQELIGDGARREDWPPTRVLNHFHNPLTPWPSAGLHIESMDGTRSIDGLSSVLWQQYPAQHGDKAGGDWAWHDARRWYLTALATLAATEREQAFAETFLTLGHLVHLIQDASVPAHVSFASDLMDGVWRLWTF